MPHYKAINVQGEVRLKAKTRIEIVEYRSLGEKRYAVHIWFKDHVEVGISEKPNRESIMSLYTTHPPKITRRKERANS